MYKKLIFIDSYSDRESYQTKPLLLNLSFTTLGYPIEQYLLKKILDASKHTVQALRTNGT